MKKIIVELTKTEADHLLYLLEVNERDAWYVGNKKQYFKRANQIKGKLLKTHRKPEGKKQKRRKIMLLSSGNEGQAISTKAYAEKCKPDYEGMILRLRARAELTGNFKAAALAYFQGATADGKMAELIGELVTKHTCQVQELESLIKRQEEEA